MKFSTVHSLFVLIPGMEGNLNINKNTKYIKTIILIKHLLLSAIFDLECAWRILG